MIRPGEKPIRCSDVLSRLRPEMRGSKKILNNKAEKQVILITQGGTCPISNANTIILM
jgi:hypothetical protein